MEAQEKIRRHKFPFGIIAIRGYGVRVNRDYYNQLVNALQEIMEWRYYDADIDGIQEWRRNQQTLRLMKYQCTMMNDVERHDLLQMDENTGLPLYAWESTLATACILDVIQKIDFQLHDLGLVAQEKNGSVTVVKKELSEIK